MALPVIRSGGLVSMEINPPLEFIEGQTGAFQARLFDLMPLWERFVPVLADIEREQFATEGHGDWPPLAASTVNDKARHGFPPFPLIRTGRLYESLTDGQLAARLNPDSMSYGTDVEYARYHQEGGQRIVNKRATIWSDHTRQGESRQASWSTNEEGHPPKRPLIDITVSDRRRLEAQMVGWINEVAAETLGRMAA